MSDDRPRLKEIFAAESGKLKELIEITEFILEAIQKNDKRQSIVSLLSTRESVLREIVAAEDSAIAELERAGKDASDLESDFPEELEFIRCAVLEVRALDEKLIGGLQEQKEEIIKELKQIKVGQILPDQYKKHENGGPSFINIRE